MLNSKLFLIASTVLLIIYVLLLVGFSSNNLSGDDAFEVIPINGGAVGPKSFDSRPRTIRSVSLHNRRASIPSKEPSIPVYHLKSL
ncbi:hypothetical protein Hanom_Chr14g01320061 [Helianthus anomalus]